ncbi:hypothetical protein AB6A40_011042 [Gnathostoma spinigerum]|uniref:Olfactomedin-like domain-containing protein n=1 Tax=Gnathostoma spinigerum TaxID=75299 RepID=A0ABD6EX29_9BILA
MGLPGPPGPQGPPGLPGRPGICPKCRIAEGFEVHQRVECPKVERMECPKKASLDGDGSPRFVDRPLPYFVKLMIENETNEEVKKEIDSCMKVCLTNISAPVESALPTSTEMAYIEGATAHCYLQNIGKPIFHAHSNTYYGAWMRDAYPRSGQDMMKRWVTSHFQGQSVTEYLDEAALRRHRVHVMSVCLLI